VRETELSLSDFIYPIFVIAGEDVKNPIPSMPGIFQLSINHAVEEAKRAYSLGISGVLLSASRARRTRRRAAPTTPRAWCSSPRGR
jgi:delta-aminolevulinic acid dehydratase/porphobilinogen synthase